MTYNKKRFDKMLDATFLISGTVPSATTADTEQPALTLDALVESLPILYYMCDDGVPDDGFYKWQYPSDYKMRQYDFVLLMHSSKLDEARRVLRTTARLVEITPDYIHQFRYACIKKWTTPTSVYPTFVSRVPSWLSHVGS